MSRQSFNIGSIANDGTGDALRVAFEKVQANFIELYTLTSAAPVVDWTNITSKPSFANVSFTGSYADLTNKPTLSAVATSGSYTDLSGRPTLSLVATSGSYADLINKPTFSPVATTGSYIDLTNKPSLSTVATTGSYNDLLDKPAAPTLVGYATETYVTTQIANIVNSAPETLNTLNELAQALGSDPNFSTSVSTALGNRLRIDVNNQGLTTEQKTNATTNLGLATVASTGSYSDLTNKPTLATVAATGSYNDLTDKPVSISFSVYNSIQQSLTSGQEAKITFDTAEFNVQSAFNTSNSRFQPNVAGYYYVSGTAYFTQAVTFAQVIFKKNGTVFSAGGPAANVAAQVTSHSAVVYLNGSTDYVEMWAIGVGTVALQAGNWLTKFQGAMFSGQSAADSSNVFFDSNTVNTLDYNNGSYQRWAPTGSVTLAISNWPAAGVFSEMVIEGVNLGAATITWPTVNWIKSDGSMTTVFNDVGVTLQSSGIDFVVLWTRDGGTTVYGKIVR